MWQTKKSQRNQIYDIYIVFLAPFLDDKNIIVSILREVVKLFMMANHSYKRTLLYEVHFCFASLP